MSIEYVVHLGREAFYLVFLISAPILCVSMVIGLMISVFQAATSINEMTLTFVPKIIAAVIILIIAFPWMLELLISFTTNLINSIPAVVKGQ